MKRIITCPICKTDKHGKVLKVKSFSILKCQNCQLEFLSPIPSDDQLNKFYQENYFTGQHSGVSGYANYESLTRSLEKEAVKRIKLIKKFTRKRKLLDVGAGTGVFLNVASKQGFKVSGNDISQFAANQIKKSGFKTYQGPINQDILPKESFDIITAWDVVEHLPNIIDATKTISLSLKPNGYFFLTTPNTESIDARIMGKHWYGYKKIPEHLWYFNKQSITKLLTQNGFEKVEVYSWGFYRNLHFIFKRLESYSPIFRIFSNVTHKIGMGDLQLFFPFTDFLVVAKKGN